MTMGILWPRRQLVTGVLVAELLVLSSLGVMGYASSTESVRSFPATPSVYSAADWSNWAAKAWAYFQPGVGVNSATGLHTANLDWGCFTDWDLGTYIYAIIFARKLNLIGDGGTWQFSDRINKIFNFLVNRPLRPADNRPYWAYSWSTQSGQYVQCPGIGWDTDPADEGRLLAALHAVRVFSPSYASQVNAVYLRTKAMFDSFATQIGPGYYGYLFAQEGYAKFGYDETDVIDSVDSYAGSYVTVYGQSLPTYKTLAEPFVLEIFEGTPSQAFVDYANLTYLAQQGRWSDTGKLTAWSEGGYGPPSYYAYEFVIDTCTVPPQQWVIRTPGCASIISGPPVAYTKVAFSYLAFYGENTFTLALVNAVKNLADPTKGFGEGAFENATSAAPLFSTSPGAFYSDKTNELVIAAAHAALGARVSFFTNPNSKALIGWGSCGGPLVGHGQSIYSSYGSITVCYVPSGYTISTWSCTGGLACSGSENPTTVMFSGPGSITLNLKTGSLSNPVSTSLSASASPNPVQGGTQFTVSGTLSSGGTGLGGKQIFLTFGWDTPMVAVTTQSGGSYSSTVTAPAALGTYNIQAYFPGDLSGSPQYTPSMATATITVNVAAVPTSSSNSSPVIATALMNYVGFDATLRKTFDNP